MLRVDRVLGRHSYVILQADGIFLTAENGGSRGTWRLENSVLYLLWYDYRPDSLVMLESGKRFSCPYYKGAHPVFP